MSPTNNGRSLSYFAPAFDKFFAQFESFFFIYRRDVSAAAKQYLCGLLREVPRKNIEQMSERVPGSLYDALHNITSQSPWSHWQINRSVAAHANRLIGGTRSALIIDETAFSKKGNDSVGVARQWNGRLGKLDNCQVGVFAALCNKTYSTLVDFRLYLPAAWAHNRQRCKKAAIPNGQRKYKSKIELAQELVESTIAAGVEFAWIIADAVYGSLAFAHYLNNCGIRFVLDTRVNQRVYLADPEPYLPRRRGSRGRPCAKKKTKRRSLMVKTVKKRIKPQQWKAVRVRKGTKGHLWVEAFAIRVFFWNGKVNEPPIQWWLVITRDRGSGDTKYFFSNMPACTSVATLVRIHRHRYWIERNFQDAKTSVGMAQYQVRCWQGWHHHMALCMTAMLFMLQMKVQHQHGDGRLTSQTIVFCMTVLIPSRIQSAKDMNQIIAKRRRKIRSAEKSALRRQKRQIMSASKVPK